MISYYYGITLVYSEHSKRYRGVEVRLPFSISDFSAPYSPPDLDSDWSIDLC